MQDLEKDVPKIVINVLSSAQGLLSISANRGPSYYRCCIFRDPFIIIIMSVLPWCLYIHVDYIRVLYSCGLHCTLSCKLIGLYFIVNRHKLSDGPSVY